MTLRVLISTSSFGRVGRKPIEMLMDAGLEWRLNPNGRTLDPDETIDLLDGVDGLIAGTERLDRSVLSSAPALRVVSRCGAGVDGVDLEAARELGIEVFNTQDAHVDGVAELTLAGMLDVLRDITAADRRLRGGEWGKRMGRLLRGKTVGIVGLGRVGKRLVTLLAPFDVRVLAVDPARDDAFAERTGIVYRELDELLNDVDILTLHVPYTRQAHHLLDRERLRRLRPGAIVVNTGRGGLIDEAALHEALRDGHLAGAYLDTFESEPYRGPLTELPNLLLTPHIGSYAAESRLAMEIESVENLLRFFQVGSEASP